MGEPVAIGGRLVGPGHPCYVIAEAGVNHDGDVETALELVRAAHAAGADAVKFQLFRADELASSHAPKAAYQLETTDPTESQHAMLHALELPVEAFERLRDEAARLGIDFLASAYAEPGLDVLDRLGVPAFKTASAQIVELPLLAHAARFGRPMIVATGMATLDEIDAALAAVAAAGGPPVVLLQCTTDYPTCPEDANLRVIPTLAERYDVPVGFSDHTVGDVAAVAAVALGACMLEKHLTLDPSRPGPDHSSSLAPEALGALVGKIREAEAALGSAVKAPTAREVSNARGMRRSVFAVETIAAGASIERRQLGLRRPASGLPPAELDRVVGRRAAAEIPAGTPVRVELLEP